MSDKQIPIIPEGDYLCTLLRIESGIAKIRPIPFNRLFFQSKEPVTLSVDMGDTICSTTEKLSLIVHVYGSHTNCIAWQRLIDQDFTIRVKHRESSDEDRIFLDTTVIK